jgi:hypothetical protein
MTEEAGSPGVEGSPGAEATPGSSEGSAQVAPDWGAFKESLGEMGQDKALEPIKDFNGLTKSYIEAQKMIGGSIRLPGKDLSPEDKTKAVNTLVERLRTEGILESLPGSPDGYEIALPQIEGFEANEPLIASFKETAHNVGIPPSQAQALFDWYLNYQESARIQEQTEFETMKADMKKELGGLYPRRMEAARRAVAKYIGAEGDELISHLPPQVGRKLVMAFAEVGEPLLEDELDIGRTIPGIESKEQVYSKLLEMMGDPKHPLNDVSHPGHKEAVEEYTKLNRMYVSMK